MNSIIFFSITLFLLISYMKYVIREENIQKQIILDRKREEEARLRAIKLSNIDNMDGLEFEKYIAWLLEQKGYQQIEVTKGSGDFGVDIVASYAGMKYAIQVKRYSSNLSRRAVSDAVAGKDHYFCSSAMVVTNSYFTKQAKLFADSVNCELVDRDMLVDWIQDICSINKDHIHSLQAINQIPPRVMEKINKLANELYPSSHSLQQITIEFEIEAYKKIRKLKAFAKQEMPELAFKKIYAESQRSNHASINDQLKELEREMEAYKNDQQS